MQFTNTSGVTSQTDTNQHNAGGELHARLRNDEQHTSTPGPAGVEGAGGAGGPDRRAGGRRRSLSTHKRQARTIGGAARPAGPGRTSHRHPDRLEAAARPAGPGRGAGGRRQGIEPTRRAPSSAKAQLVWRTPEGTAAVPVGGGRAQPGFKIDHSKPYAHETHAVPVGGGRAWPGFEIDHSERSSRVAISRAGRRPPAPTRRHKHSATNT